MGISFTTIDILSAYTSSYTLLEEYTLFSSNLIPKKNLLGRLVSVWSTPQREEEKLSILIEKALHFFESLEKVETHLKASYSSIRLYEKYITENEYEIASGLLEPETLLKVKNIFTYFFKREYPGFPVLLSEIAHTIFADLTGVDREETEYIFSSLLKLPKIISYHTELPIMGLKSWVEKVNEIIHLCSPELVSSLISQRDGGRIEELNLLWKLYFSGVKIGLEGAEWKGPPIEGLSSISENQSLSSCTEKYEAEWYDLIPNNSAYIFFD